MNNEYDYSGLYNNSANHADATQNVTEPLGQQPPVFTPQPPHKKGGTAKRVVAFAVAAVICFGAGVGGGYLGSMLNAQNVISEATSAAKNQTTSVVVPTVATDADALTVPEISAKVKPSVVVVTTENVQTNQYFGSYVTSGAGSGVIISDDGYIITNAHVINGASSVTVTLNSGDAHSAQIVGYDNENDIAVLKIDATGLAPATIGDSSKLVVGEFSVAVGNPLGRLGGTVTDGIISALDREVTVEEQTMTLLQTSASISPGSSGGGLFNARGELVGITNAKPSSSGAEGLGFAIPINTAYEVAQDIINNKGTSGTVMGISVVNVSDAQTAAQYGVSSPGLYIQAVTAGSGAETAGLQVGDMFVAVDGQAVATSEELKSILKEHEPGDVVEVQLVREKKIVTAKVTLQEAFETVAR